MGKVYSKDKIIKIMKEAKSDIKNFYKKEFVNYLGVTSDTKEYYLILLK